MLSFMHPRAVRIPPPACRPPHLSSRQQAFRLHELSYYCYYGGIVRLCVAFLFARFRHCLHYWNTRFTWLKDTVYTIHYLKYTIHTIYTIETHYLHCLHYWNTLFALFALLKYTFCTIYTIERHYFHYLHYWFTLLTLSSHLICTICTI